MNNVTKMHRETNSEENPAAVSLSLVEEIRVSPFPPLKAVAKSHPLESTNPHCSYTRNLT